jgi:hypothetical protein
VNRQRQARANATADAGDTIRSLADLIRLNPGEWPDWLQTNAPNNVGLDTPLQANCPWTFSVPNTAYVDISKQGWREWMALARFWHGYAGGAQAAWNAEGLRVVVTDENNSGQLVANHMNDADLYKYLYIGHGNPATGSLTGMDLSVPAGRWTRFGIAEMQLIGCGTSTGQAQWRTNVSARGALVTMVGTYNALYQTFRIDSGGATQDIDAGPGFFGLFGQAILQVLQNAAPRGNTLLPRVGR